MILHFGPDKIQMLDSHVLIFSPRDMPEWRLRAFCRVPIFFRGAKYQLLDKKPAQAPFRMQYELTPWVDEQRGESANAIIYDAAYVFKRETAMQSDRRYSLLYCLLMPAYPFLGLLWSQFKHRHLWPCGFDVHSITGASVLVQFSLFLLLGIFVSYLGARDSFVCWMLLLVLGSDCAMRCAALIDSDGTPYGFLEWVRVRRKSPKANANSQQSQQR